MPDKIKILVVDDLPEKLLVYQTILEELDEDLVLARSASEALGHLLRDDFAVIILDVNMPEMDGFEAAAMIRARKRCAHTPIIFITAYVDELHAMKGYSYGAVDYILSPVNPDVLRTKVRVFVDLFRKKVEVERQARVLREFQEREHRREMYETEERLRLALDAGRMGACEWDLGANLLNWSPTLEAIFGYGPGEFNGSADELSSRLHPEDRQRVLDTMMESVQAGRDFCIEHRIIRPNNQIAWVELRGKIFADATGRPARFTGVCMDITERKLVEAELARHREMLEELVRHRTAELEASYQRLQLADRLASIGTLAAGLGHDMGNLLLPVRVRLDSLDQRIGSIRRKSEVGSQRSEVGDQRADDGGGEGRGQKTEVRGQRAEVTGQRSDVNSQAAEVLTSDLRPLTSDLSAAHDDIKAIRTACDYLNRLSQGLRLFALDPQKSGSSDSTDLSAWWLDVESFLRNSLPKHVRLECRLPDDLPRIAIAPHAFTQVIYNLVQNAGDAMRDQEQGRVVLAAHLTAAPLRGELDPLAAPARGIAKPGLASSSNHHSSLVHSLSDGKAQACVVFSVCDDGPGMSEDVRQRCMEPFFSTKTRQISTGLGLALVRGTIYNANGSIQIDSAPGRGTTFRLTIPKAQRVIRAPVSDSGEPHAAHIIMSDQRIHAYVKSLLEGFGMRVHDGDWSLASNAHLLVLENPNGRWNDVCRFLEIDHRRRAIVLGDLPEGDPHPQVVTLGLRPPPVQIRKAICEVLKSELTASDEAANIPVAAGA